MAIGKWAPVNLEDYRADPLRDISTNVAEWMKEYTHGFEEGGKNIPTADLRHRNETLTSSSKGPR